MLNKLSVHCLIIPGLLLAASGLQAANMVATTPNTLMALIDEANDNEEDDFIDLLGYTISFDCEAGPTYVADGPNALPSVEPDGGHSVTLKNGTLYRSEGDCRFLHVDEGANLLLEDMVLKNGRAVDGDENAADDPAQGGAIFSKGRLTLDRTEFRYNSAVSSNNNMATGGAIFLYDYSGSIDHIRDSFFIANSAQGGYFTLNSTQSSIQARGGAIEAQLGTNIWEISRTTFANNFAHGGDCDASELINTTTTNAGQASGGAIDLFGAAIHELVDVVFDGNRAMAGKADANEDPWVVEPRICNGSPAYGGAINLAFFSFIGEQTITSANFYNNVARGSDAVVFEDDLVVCATAGQAEGGAIRTIDSNIGTIDFSTFDGNIAQGGSAIEDSCDYGSADGSSGHGGAIRLQNDPPNLNSVGTMSNSTCSHNESRGEPDRGSAGGCLYIGEGATIEYLDFNTFSGNKSADIGGAIYLEIDDPAVPNGIHRMSRNTVVENEADQTTGGGGIFIDSGRAITEFFSNIVALNIVALNPDGVPDNGSDIVDYGGEWVSIFYGIEEDDPTTVNNFIGTPGGHGITNLDDANKVGTSNEFPLNPMLGPLADNGGPTFTHHPLPRSPVINMGSNPINPGYAFDQRGFPYSNDRGSNTPDIGSVEVQDCTYIGDFDDDGICDDLDPKPEEKPPVCDCCPKPPHDHPPHDDCKCCPHHHVA